VYFSPDWLKTLLSAFEHRPDMACIGGKVMPLFESERPAWLEDDLLDVYSIKLNGDHEREIQPPEYPIGCNMAFRHSVFENIGGFPTSLCRKSGNLLSNDETYFLLRIAKAGLKTLYAPGVQVSHRILPDRTTLRWLLRRWYWQGISDVALLQIGDDRLPRVNLAKKAVKTLLGLLRQWKNTAELLRPESGRIDSESIRKQIKVCHQFGMLRQFIAEAFTLPYDKGINK
jgi:GT2 family glycosyltransferase